jgi:hypothetical protein
LVQFSDVVQKLAKEEEPFRGVFGMNTSAHIQASSSPRGNLRSQGKAERESATKLENSTLYARGKSRVPEDVKLGD